MGNLFIVLKNDWSKFTHPTLGKQQLLQITAMCAPFLNALYEHQQMTLNEFKLTTN